MRNVSVHRRDLLRASLFMGSTLGLSAGVWARADDQSPVSLNDRLAGDVSPVHDPCIIKQGDTYHLFSTGQAQDPTGLLPWRNLQGSA